MSAVSDASTKRPPEAQRRWYLQRVLIAVAVLSAVGLALLLVWSGAQVLLLVFAGLLMAVFVRALGDWLGAHTPLSPGWALVAVLLGLAGVLALSVWLVVPTISQQAQALAERLPSSLQQARQLVTQLPFGQHLLAQAPRAQQLLPPSTNVLGRATGIFSTLLGGLVNILIILFAGIYFAADPGLYKRGLLHLVPLSKRERAGEVLQTLGYTLRFWLLGRVAIMALNGTLTALALWWLGIPLPVLNGIITGLLNFIPNIGPFLAAVPPVLLALAQNPTQAVWVIGLYLVIQNLEGFVLTPLVQQRTVELPPVLTIAVQILLGVLFGFLGVLVAVPLTAVGFVLVKMLYVEDVLGDQINVKGEREIRRQTAI